MVGGGRGVTPKSLKILIFAKYGRLEAGNTCKMMPQGVGSFSTPGKPLPRNLIFRQFLVPEKGKFLFARLCTTLLRKCFGKLSQNHP